MCSGLCNTDLTIDGADVTITLGSWQDTSSQSAVGRLTTEGGAELAAVQSELDGVHLEATYGCPDCADGGSAWVQVGSSDAAETRSTYEFGNPPPELTQSDRLISSLTDALSTCQSTKLVDVDASCELPPNS